MTDDPLKYIEKLVLDVAKSATSDSMTVHEKMDALKLLTPYYAVLKKAKAKSDDDAPEGEPTMGAIRDRLRVIEEPANGGIETSTRRRRN